MGNNGKSKYSKRKFLIAFIGVMGILAIVRHLFVDEIVMQKHDVAMTEQQPDEPDALNNTEEKKKTVHKVVKKTIVKKTVKVVKAKAKAEEKQSTAVRRGRWISPVWSYDRCFPDLQDTQLAVAQRLGVTPSHSREEALRHVMAHRLVDVSRSPYYRLDTLTHSMPYLVPRAQHLLTTIGINFIDSCQSKGLPVHLPVVTSVLRTASDVSRLQRGNGNATTNSCHCYGTTIDITYNKFYPVATTYEPSAELTRWDDDLKRILAEVLLDLRKRGLCYVKYERKQACFHLTCR